MHEDKIMQMDPSTESIRNPVCIYIRRNIRSVYIFEHNVCVFLFVLKNMGTNVLWALFDIIRFHP